jgi:hypothetical protein
MERVVDTFDDYFENEILGFITETDFRRLATVSLDRLVKRYVYDLITSKFNFLQQDTNNSKNSGGGPNSPSLKQLLEDEALIRKCFSDYLRERVVETTMCLLTDVRALLQVDQSGIGVAFEKLYSHNPGINKQTMNALLALRADLDKHQLRQAAEICRQIIDRQAPHHSDYER